MIQTNSFNVRNLLLTFCPTSINVSFTRLCDTICFVKFRNWRYVEPSVRNVRQPSYKVISFRKNIGNGEQGRSYRGIQETGT